MVFILFSLILFAGIAFFQTIQGTFSALIMLVLTILSAAVAVNFYAPISHGYLLEYIPDYADPAALAVLFTVTLVVLRSLADNFIRTNIVIWQWPDRVLAGAISIPVSLILVGVATIGFQMLPFDGQVLLFNRWVPDNDGRLVRSGIFPYADDFTNKILGSFSDGCLQSDLKFGTVHPDWAGEISAQRIAVQKESKHAIPPGLAKVTLVWKREGPLLIKEYDLEGSSYRGASKKKVTVKDNNRLPANGNIYLATRIQLDQKAADGDGYHRFSWGQIRLVGFQGSDRTTPINYYAVGVRDPDFPAEFNYMRVKVKEPPPSSDDEAEPDIRDYGLVSRQPAKGSMSFDVVFEVPENFTPWFLEYKRWSRSPMPKISDKDPDKGKAAPVKAAEEKKSVGEAGAGMHVDFQIDSARTAFTNELPFKLTSAGAGKVGPADAEISSNKYVKGRVYGKVGGSDAEALDGRSGGRIATVDGFEVPKDKRLLRMECRFEKAQTQFLQKIFGSVQNVLQKKAIDKKGGAHLPVGQYVMVDEGNSVQKVELIYDPEAESSGRLEPFREIQLGQLDGKSARVGFLFLVDPGTEMDRFEVGGQPFQAQSLQLKAPN